MSPCLLKCMKTTIDVVVDEGQTVIGVCCCSLNFEVNRSFISYDREVDSQNVETTFVQRLF